jgi:hypothetical protein
VDHDFQGIADLQLLGFDRQRQFAEGQDALGFAADVDEEFVLVLGDDDAREDLALVENLEALFVEALFERELVFFFMGRLDGRLDGGRDGEVTSFVLYFLFLAAAAPPGPALADHCAYDRFPTS